MVILAPLSIYFEHEGLAKLCHTQTPVPMTINFIVTKEPSLCYKENKFTVQIANNNKIISFFIIILLFLFSSIRSYTPFVPENAENLYLPHRHFQIQLHAILGL